MQNNSIIRVATRQSRLALVQTEQVIAWLTLHQPDVCWERVTFSTTGDQRLDWSLENRGGTGLFTVELERALLEDRADVAVHSAKDMPTILPEGLGLAGFLPREDAHDVLIVRDSVETPSCVATGSPRRRAQITRMFPKARFSEIRGNVETRLRKIATGEADATLLAAAGLKRLGIETWPGLVFQPLSLEDSVPAAGQAAIALQCRASETGQWESCLDQETATAVFLERAVLRSLGGGCHTAVGVHCTKEGQLFLFRDSIGRQEMGLPPGWEGSPPEELAKYCLSKLGTSL